MSYYYDDPIPEGPPKKGDGWQTLKVISIIVIVCFAFATTMVILGGGC